MSGDEILRAQEESPARSKLIVIIFWFGQQVRPLERIVHRIKRINEAGISQKKRTGSMLDF